MKVLFFFLLLIFAKSIFAQYDTIVLVTGQKLPAIVKEISDKHIKYKNPKDSLGPTLVIKKKLIERFILRNGCIEMKEIGYENCVKDPTFGVLKEEDFKRRVISVDLTQLLMRSAQLNFEYIFKKRNLGIGFVANKALVEHRKINKYVYNKSIYEEILLRINPVSNNKNSYYYKLAYFGANLKVYPKAHKKSTYFMSFGLDIGKASAKVKRTELVYTYGTDYYGNQVQTGYYFQNLTTYHESYFQSFSYTNGFVFRPAKHIVFQLFGLVGLNRFIDPPAPSYMVQHSEKRATYFVRYGIGISAGFAF